MKIGIVFYSFSGKTRIAAEYLRDVFLSKDSEAELIAIKPLKEDRIFIKQCVLSFFKKEPVLAPYLNYELGRFSYIIFASPVWAFHISPALRSYLRRAEGIENKKAACFVTYGRGLGVKKSLEELSRLLKDKGAVCSASAALQDYRIKDKAYLQEKLKSLF